MATVGKWEREERSRCIDRRHKIHFMTWTLSSDWCISRRIASQIKRSSTLEPPLTTSPGPRRRRTMPSTLVCISHPTFSLSLYLYVSPILSRYTSAGLQAKTHQTVLLHGLVPLKVLPASSHTVHSRREKYYLIIYLPVRQRICFHSNQRKTVYNPAPLDLHVCSRHAFLKTNESFPPPDLYSESVTMTFSRTMHGTVFHALLKQQPRRYMHSRFAYILLQTLIITAIINTGRDFVSSL